MPTSQALPAGSLIIERYRIIERVGGGAMAQVYRVEDVETGEIHALKVLRNPATEDSVSASHFVHTAKREALFLKTLSHPALPRFEDLFSDAQYVYLLMEYIEGHNLKIYLEQDEMRTLDIRQIVHWGVQICDTLAYLHRREPPIVFRDLKPSNLIRRPDGRICLVDFGIARYASKKNATDTVVLGSPGYAPPEQYGQGQTEPRSDLYALGATLHHLITGRDPSISPFKWPTVRSLNPLIPRPLDNLIMRCVSLDIEKRPDSAEQVGAALRETLAMLDEAAGAIYAVASGPQMEQPTGKLTRSDAPTRHLEILEEARENKRPAPQVAADGSRLLSSESATPLNRVQYTQAHYTPEKAAPVWENKEVLRRWLLIAALFAIFGSVGLPMMSGAFEPSASETEFAPTLASSASPTPQAAQRREELRVESENREARQARDAYRALTPLRFLLTLIACGGFLMGAVRTERPGRRHLLLCLGAAACLLLLTALTLLPANPGLFALLTALEALLTAPALLLLAAGPMRRY